MERNRLIPTGDLARWEEAHPFNRNAQVDPLLAFRIRNRRRHHDDDDAPSLPTRSSDFSGLMTNEWH